MAGGVIILGELGLGRVLSAVSRNVRGSDSRSEAKLSPTPTYLSMGAGDGQTVSVYNIDKSKDRIEHKYEYLAICRYLYVPFPDNTRAPAIA